VSREANLTEQQYAEMLKRRDAAVPLAGKPPKVSAKRGMNRWEQEYGMELEARRRAGEIKWYGFEPVRLRLADGAFYKPDFMVVQSSGKIQFHEVKGFLRIAANIRFKVAAEAFPFAEFLMIRKRKAKEGGGWDLIKHLNA
jgi:hypothetical protein